MTKHYLGGSAKTLTSAQMKFAQVLVYGVEGNPVSKSAAAKIAGYADWIKEGTRLTNPN